MRDSISDVLIKGKMISENSPVDVQPLGAIMWDRVMNLIGEQRGETMSNWTTPQAEKSIEERRTIVLTISLGGANLTQARGWHGHVCS